METAPKKSHFLGGGAGTGKYIQNTLIIRKRQNKDKYKRAVLYLILAHICFVYAQIQMKMSIPSASGAISTLRG